MAERALAAALDKLAPQTIPVDPGLPQQETGSARHRARTDTRAKPAAAGGSLERLWRLLMFARVLVAAILAAIYANAPSLSLPAPGWLLPASIAYLAFTLLQRFAAPRAWRRLSFDAQWIAVGAVDLLCFGALHLAQLAGINYAPLLVLPVLMSATLGSRPLALGTALLSAMILLGGAVLYGDAAARPAQLVQAAYTGAGLLAIAWLANYLTSRLLREEAHAARSRSAAAEQSLVNNLVLEAMSDGVLVLDSSRRVRSANPAARSLLGIDREMILERFRLTDSAGWAPLAALAEAAFRANPAGNTEIALQTPAGSAVRLQVRTEHTAPVDGEERGLCVMFLQDMRLLEARLRTEKLASMGRMSAAVAHELRNPLAAISQANALLAEELSGPPQSELSRIVAQNVQRLDRIVEDVLDAARVDDTNAPPETVALHEQARAFCAEWASQHAVGDRLIATFDTAPALVRFGHDHLRRVLINLLDNAARHASSRTGAIQASSTTGSEGATLWVWSDGAPIEAGVQRHLFEPFFSSQSRSSGLGLFICRQLCERHGASINYARDNRMQGHDLVPGNEFTVQFRMVANDPVRPLQQTPPPP